MSDEINKTQVDDDTEFDWPEDEDAVLRDNLSTAHAGILNALREAKELQESLSLDLQRVNGLYASAYAMKSLAATSKIRMETIHDTEQTFFDSPFFGWVIAMGKNAEIVRNAAIANMDNYITGCKQQVEHCQVIAGRAVELTRIANLHYDKVFIDSVDMMRLAPLMHKSVLDDFAEVLLTCNKVIQEANKAQIVLDYLREIPQT